MASSRARLWAVALGLLAAGGALPAHAQIVASALPLSRRVPVGSPATFLATVINAGLDTAEACTITPGVAVSASFAAFRLDALASPPNAPVSIPGQQLQSFLLSFTPASAFAPVEVPLVVDCANTAPAPSLPGINTVRLGATASPAPDVVALARTATGDGIVVLDDATGAGAFAVATVNVGGPGPCTASVAATSPALPVVTAICETDPVSGLCVPGQGPAASVSRDFGAGATPTFAVFVARGAGPAPPFDPARDRLLVTFTDAAGDLCGATGVAVRVPSAPAQRELTVTKAPPPGTGGAGRCTVRAVGPGLECGPDCSQASAAYAAGMLVDLQALVEAGSVLVEWGGDCAGAAACQVAMDENRSVSARCLRDRFTGAIQLLGSFIHPVTGCPYNLSLVGNAGLFLTGGPAGVVLIEGVETIASPLPIQCPSTQELRAIGVPIVIAGAQVSGSTVAGNARLTVQATLLGGEVAGSISMTFLPPWSGSFAAPLALSALP